MKGLSHTLTNLSDSAVSMIVTRSRREQWTDVLALASGEPRFPVPPEGIAQLNGSDLSLVTKYSPFKGYEELLELIQQKLATINRVQASTDEIIVMPGGSTAIYACIMCVANPGDEILISDPCWEHYPQIVRMAGAAPAKFAYSFDNKRYNLDLESLERAISKRTKAVLINNPLNPCGAVLTEQEIQSLASCCERHGLWLIVDEEYETFIYDDNTHHSVGSASPTTISIHSFSKSFAVTGIRLGYVRAPIDVITLLRRFALYSYMCPPSPSQCMAIGILKSDYRTYLSRVRELYQQKMAFFYEQVRRVEGVECWRPEGGVYLFPKLKVNEGTNLADQLASEFHVLSVPGEVSGNGGNGHIRLFFGLDENDLLAAAKRLGEFMVRHGNRRALKAAI